jgi:hypothetical protein
MLYVQYSGSAPDSNPLGPGPAVCLTQDVPPEGRRQLLLLGCGDVRNVLFTIYNDNKFGKLAADVM